MTMTIRKHEAVLNRNELTLGSDRGLVKLHDKLKSSKFYTDDRIWWEAQRENGSVVYTIHLPKGKSVVIKSVPPTSYDCEFIDERLRFPQEPLRETLDGVDNVADSVWDFFFME